jgi:hypothetical protein
MKAKRTKLLGIGSEFKSIFETAQINQDLDALILFSWER